MAQTTKKAIAASLKRLLGQKPLTKSTVTDVAKDCNISRHTFYYHFRDVYDLMEWTCRAEGECLLEGQTRLCQLAAGNGRKFSVTSATTRS